MKNIHHDMILIIVLVKGEFIKTKSCCPQTPSWWAVKQMYWAKPSADFVQPNKFSIIMLASYYFLRGWPVTVFIFNI